MKVNKSVDLETEGVDITKMFERKLLETCAETSVTYSNNMKAFAEMLQEVADKAFKLGQQNP